MRSQQSSIEIYAYQISKVFQEIDFLVVFFRCSATVLIF